MIKDNRHAILSGYESGGPDFQLEYKGRHLTLSGMQ